MFEVGFSEIILIFGIALLVLGPARLPKLAADIGRWAGRARAMARQLRTQLEQETQFDPLADTKPATVTPSNTIHTPAPPPASTTPPQTSPETTSGPASDPSPAVESATAGEDSRAAPAQLATAVPAPPTTVAALDEPVSPRPTADAIASPAKTDTDEPRAG